MSVVQRIRRARAAYCRDSLDESRVAPDPFEQFGTWLAQALSSGVLVEPYAMTLATVGNDGQPSARIVLLRGYDRRGFVFFTNYDSRKGRELSGGGRAALLFYWDALERQVRLEGVAARLLSQESDAYFALRPRGHQLSAWASAQSSQIASRAALEEQMRVQDERFSRAEVARPPYWGGYRIEPHVFEFWQGRTNRMHDRILYTREREHWRIDRLSP